jgi:hypothetical protein
MRQLLPDQFCVDLSAEQRSGRPWSPDASTILWCRQTVGQAYSPMYLSGPPLMRRASTSLTSSPRILLRELLCSGRLRIAQPSKALIRHRADVSVAPTCVQGGYIVAMTYSQQIDGGCVTCI